MTETDCSCSGMLCIIVSGADLLNNISIPSLAHGEQTATSPASVKWNCGQLALARLTAMVAGFQKTHQ